MRVLRERPDFRLLFAGLVAGMVGDWLLLLVPAIWVKDLTGSSGAAGLTMFFIALPMALAPVLGAVVDRFRRRRFLVVTNTAAAAILLPLLTVDGPEDVWVIYAVAAGFGASSILHGAALNGLLKLLLPDELLVEANGILQTVKQGLRLVGPLAGAGLFAAFDGAVVAVIDAGSFLVAAGVLAILRITEPEPVRESAPWLAEVSAGARHVFAEPALRRGVLTLAIAVLMIGMMESISFELNEKGLHRPPEFVSVLVTVMGFGAVAGGVLAARIVRRFGELTIVGAATVVEGLAVLGLIVPFLPTILLILLVVGFVVPVENVADTTMLQRRTSQELMGRASAAYEAMIGIPQIVAIGIGAALVTVLDYRWILPVMGVVLLGAGGYALRGRALTPPHRPASEPHEPFEAGG